MPVGGLWVSFFHFVDSVNSRIDSSCLHIYFLCYESADDHFGHFLYI